MTESTNQDVFETLPGLRDTSGAPASHDGHGIDEILNVVSQLAAAGIPSCVVGIKALRYYGAAREWDLCVPDDKLEDAQKLLLRDDADEAEYEKATSPPPVPWSLRHTFPCLRLKGYNFYVVLVPSSDYFVDPSQAEHVERSRNGVPYASLVQFARSLLLQQIMPDLADFIDGMDLTFEWGAEHIGFETLQEESVEFWERRNERVKKNGDDFGRLAPQVLEEVWYDRASKEAKSLRIEPMKQGRYFTRWRRFKAPEDPRTRDRPV
ncbi:hypothetical protein C8A05DRAFT_40999 [Staphylotrichum tortipilum]|uniref:Nucleotidyltransferase family protein n=1 Tax=Staphylotrichum tortipilum TaxID=2831512 RepID=A0AAN6RXJ0_9PEZI|nr:hypothetical protein C8A05DRAFT_40999 [Staphylotrichum longicolle]